MGASKASWRYFGWSNWRPVANGLWLYRLHTHFVIWFGCGLIPLFAFLVVKPLRASGSLYRVRSAAFAGETGETRRPQNWWAGSRWAGRARGRSAYSWGDCAKSTNLQSTPQDREERASRAREAATSLCRDPWFWVATTLFIGPCTRGKRNYFCRDLRVHLTFNWAQARRLWCASQSHCSLSRSRRDPLWDRACGGSERQSDC